jgi:tetratricopeptide (TPR) repeat protein
VLFAHIGLGLTAVRQRRLARGIASLERAIAICRDLALPLYVHYAVPPLAVAYALSGHPIEAVGLLEQQSGQDVKMGVECHHALMLSTLGEVYLEAGRPLDARASAERALQLSREREEPGHEARALRVLGDADAALEPPDSKQAEASYRQALVLAETLGMRPLIAHCHLGLGTLYRRTGDRAKVEEHLTSATAMYREMGMTFWLDKTKATLNQSQPSGR